MSSIMSETQTVIKPDATSQETTNQQVRSLLQQLTAKIPKSAVGIERHMAISELMDEISKNFVHIQQSLRAHMDYFLLRMLKINASDIDMGGHGGQGYIWYRIHGDKRPDKTLGSFTHDEMSMLIQALLVAQQRATLNIKRNLDFSYTITEGEQTYRFRADAYYDLDQLALNMRLINPSIFPYKNLDFHPNVSKIFNLAHDKSGMILVTGITGSGKSTTLDSIIDANNHNVEGHVVIIASPVEYVHKSDKCIIRHREVGRDTRSFKEGVVQCLRQDPDIIVIGEMRDPDTIVTALEITDSGHKVFSTLHTSSAVESIDRILGEMDPIEKERTRMRLADVLKVVVSQKLVPSLDGKRVMAKEVLICTPSVRAAIKNNNIGEIYQMISENNEIGMVTLEQDLRRLYLQKKISLETAMNFANNKRRLQQLMQMKQVSY
jgi:twitching motility protein PilT